MSFSTRADEKLDEYSAAAHRQMRAALNLLLEARSALEFRT